MCSVQATTGAEGRNCVLGPPCALPSLSPTSLPSRCQSLEKCLRLQMCGRQHLKSILVLCLHFASLDFEAILISCTETEYFEVSLKFWHLKLKVRNVITVSLRNNHNLQFVCFHPI
jgi:hypothetical protein